MPETTHNPDGNTYVWYWNHRTSEFYQVPAVHVLCDECGEHYKENEWWWDDGCKLDYPFLVCECGQQFYQEIEE